MINLACFLVLALPHFRTVYYLRGVNEAGEKVQLMLDKPTDVPEEMRHCVHHCTFLSVCHQPFFARHCCQPSE